MKIHIDWVGSHTLEEVKQLTNTDDYGVYQIYGSHPIYGSNVLLYIGKAERQVLSQSYSYSWLNRHYYYLFVNHYEL